MSPRAKKSFPFAETAAAEIARVKAERKLSLSEIHRVSGVSRRHLAELQKGANVSLLVVRAVMGALGIEDLPIGGNKRVTISLDRVGESVASVAADLEQACALTLRAAVALRELLRSSGSHAPASMDAAARAANLITDFVARVRDTESAEEFAQLERLVHASSTAGSVPPRGRSAPKTRKTGAV